MVREGVRNQAAKTMHGRGLPCRPVAHDVTPWARCRAPCSLLLPTLEARLGLLIESQETLGESHARKVTRFSVDARLPEAPHLYRSSARPAVAIAAGTQSPGQSVWNFAQCSDHSEPGTGFWI